MCPEELRYLWDWYQEVYYFEPLTFLEVQAWSEMTMKHLHSWETHLIIELSRYA